MPEVIETTVYQFEELSDAAKEKARQWFRESSDEQDFEPVIEDFSQIADLLGISFQTRPVELMSGKTRYDPCIWYQVGYVQSDFASFEGSYRYRTGAAKKVREYAPTDTRLHAIADALQTAQKRHAYGLTAQISYHHYYGQQVECDLSSGREVPDESYQEVKEAFRNLSSWLYDQLRQQDEYLNEDEQVDESILANEYTFTAEGRRFG
jgi:hypothetical protein